MKRKKYLLIILLFFGLLQWGSAAEHTINPDTTDLNAAINNIISNDSGDITINLGSGIYFINNIIEISNVDCSSLTIKGHKDTNPNDPTIIMGGTIISGWSGEGNIKTADIPEGFIADNLFEGTMKGRKRDSTSNLDQPGDFFKDGDTLYYYPRNSTANIFIPEVESIINIDGISTSQINIRNITFIGTSNVSSGEIGLIHIENAKNIDIDRCQIIGGVISGIVLINTSNITIQNNRIADFGHYGILLQNSNNNTIENNFVINGNASFDNGAGIHCYQSSSNTIENNKVMYTPGSGVLVQNYANNNDILKNDICRVAYKVGAGIWINSTNTGNNIENNRIHEITPTTSNNAFGIYIGAQTESSNGSTIVKDNMVHEIHKTTIPAYPIYVKGFDDSIYYTYYTEIVNNIVADCGRYDIVYKCTDTGYQGIKVYNNIFSNYSAQYCHFFLDCDEIPDDFQGEPNLFYHPNGQYWIYVTSTTDYNDGSSLVGDEHDPDFQDREGHHYKVNYNLPFSRFAGFHDISQSDIGLSINFPYRHASDRIEAEKCSSSSNISNNITTVHSTSSTSYIKYNNIFFEPGLEYFEIRYSCEGISPTGRQIELYIDDRQTGTLLGTFPLSGTGGVSSYMLKKQISINSYDPGTHNLFINLTGDSAGIKIDYFHFYNRYTTSLYIGTGYGYYSPEISIKEPTKTKFRPDESITLDINHNEYSAIYLCKITDNGQQIALIKLSDFPYTIPAYGTPGPHVITVSAYDVDGNFLDSASITIEVIAVTGNPPTVKITSPENNTLFPGPGSEEAVSEVVIEVEVSDPDGNNTLQKVEILIDGNIATTIEDNFNNISWSWTELTPGEHNITAVAYDNGGHHPPSLPVMICITSESLLIGWWKFDDIAEDLIAKDSSGNENHATVESMSEHSVEGYPKVGAGSILLDGESWVDTRKSLMNNLSQFTAAGWIRPQQCGSYIGFWGQKGIMAVGFRNEEQKTCTIEVFTKNHGAVSFDYPKSEYNKWHHITVIGNGEKGLSLYFDGQLVDGPSDDKTSNYGNNENNFFIGTGVIFKNKGEVDFTGNIDDVRLYSTALSELEIVYLVAIGEKNYVPNVKIASPKNAEIIKGPKEVLIQVMASDKDGEIDHVEISINNGEDGNTIYDPANDGGENDHYYEYRWSANIPGSYTIEAKAVDNGGADAVHTINVAVEIEGVDYAPIAWWKFDEESGTTAYDISGNNYNGKIIFGKNEYPVWKKGMSGNAIEFDGFTVVRAKRGLFNGNRAFTVVYWIYPKDPTSLAGIIGQPDAFSMSFKNEGEITIWTGANIWKTEIYPFSGNQWHHIAGVGTGEAVIIYIDGEEITRKDWPLPEGKDYGTSGRDFTIGGVEIITGPEQEKPFFEGLIDEVKVYSRALTPEEIKADMVGNTIPIYVEITKPENGSTHELGKEIPIKVTFNQQEESQITLEILINDYLNFSTDRAPYEYSWNPSEPGSYTIKAIATNLDGASGDDTISVIVEGDGEYGEEYYDSDMDGTENNDSNNDIDDGDGTKQGTERSSEAYRDYDDSQKGDGLFYDEKSGRYIRESDKNKTQDKNKKESAETRLEKALRNYYPLLKEGRDDFGTSIYPEPTKSYSEEKEELDLSTLEGQLKLLEHKSRGKNLAGDDDFAGSLKAQAYLLYFFITIIILAAVVVIAYFIIKKVILPKMGKI